MTIERLIAELNAVKESFPHAITSVSLADGSQIKLRFDNLGSYIQVTVSPDNHNAVDDDLFRRHNEQVVP